MEADSFVLPYRGRKVSAAKAVEIGQLSDRLIKLMIDATPHVEHSLQVSSHISH